MRQKILGFAFSTMLFALCFSAEAQQQGRIPRIGFLSGSGDPSAPSHQVEAFRQGLRDLGYVEGKNILVEYRYAEGKLDRIPILVAELVQLKVDVIVTSPITAIRAAKEATKTIPIVIVTLQDPVAAGFIDSLARPGGNITGLTRLTRELSGKRLELLKETVPKMSRAGMLADVKLPGSAIAFKEYETAARALKIKLQVLDARGPNPNLESAVKAAVNGRASALITIGNPVLNRFPERIADLAIKNRMPSLCEASSWVEAGCLLSYSSNDADSFRRAAIFVDKILKGRKPADLPVEQPMKFEFVINLKTANQIGLTIPQWTLMKADKVIR
ncbi:MAG: ABC transporter substrate-binding protein [Deltaproteobacteria bacterium]|nr:ABC transporter substrate-binding protein [Deltaproteobacteria bacterium]MDZ4343715.1 ABC transporter substrate-binding protein [Candidatus Binatia bacterium]